MPVAPLTLSTLLVLATTAGTVALALEPEPYAASAALMLTMAMVVATLVTIAGTLLARGRWARPTAGALCVVWIGLGAAVGYPWGMAALALATAGLTVAAGPWLKGWLRHQASIDGPPPAAVAALLALVATPVALALSSPGGLEAADWAFAAWSLVLAFTMGRALRGALSAARLAHPLAAAALVLSSGLRATSAAVLAAVVGGAAWRREVRLALAPVTPRGGAVRFPPELVPPDVLTAAGLDDSGLPGKAR